MIDNSDLRPPPPPLPMPVFPPEDFQIVPGEFVEPLEIPSEAVESEERVDAPEPPVETPVTWVLIADDGTEAELAASTAVGRKPELIGEGDMRLVSLPDPERALSRTHALIETVGERIWVTDLGSTNGTDVFDETGRAEMLAPNVRTEVDPMRGIGLGGRRFSFERR